MSELAARGAPANNVPDRQNQESFLRLLRARSQTYDEATRLQVVQVLLAVLLPVAGSVVGLIWTDLRPYVASIALVIAVLDTAWLDRWQRGKIKTVAKICEQFNCELLDIPWNKLAAGRRLDPEQVEAAAQAWRRGDAKLRDWYPSEIRDASLPLARVMCQRTNSWYDRRLRQRYGAWLLAIVCGAFIICLLIGLTLKLSLLDLTATVLTPAAPALIWCLREHFRQRDVVEVSETTKAEAEALCERVAAGTCGDDECKASARELQNAIYARRAASPLMLPYVYSLARRRMEMQMKVGAAELLHRLHGRW